MSQKVFCISCGYPADWDGAQELKCPKCGDIIANVPRLLKDNLIERLGIAAGFRRVGRFDDAQQELENILEQHEDLPEALFGSFLNAYEVTDYAFDENNRVKICKCNSTSKRPVIKNQDVIAALMSQPKGTERRTQWVNLGNVIEAFRQDNIRIKDRLPKYRAILIYDYANENDKALAYGLYNELSTKTDVFFPPVTLQNVPHQEQEKYLIQAIKNPEIAPLMFVVYSDAFSYRSNAKSFYSNVAAQCREFAKVHTKGELFSVICDYEPSAMMKTISIKTIRCKDFNITSIKSIARTILKNIVTSAYEFGEEERFDKGEIIQLNVGKGLSPIV